MRCGLFGKLPAKRDFVAIAAPRGFLRLVETWLERGLAESRKRIGSGDWAQAFAAAPHWRFWLDAAICGKPLLGLVVPSVDACGRAYPLLLFRLAEGGESIDPPWLDPHGEWFDAAAAFLAARADPHASFEASTRMLEALAAPTAPCRAEDLALRQRFSELLGERTMARLGSRSAWWSLDPAGRSTRVRLEADMPDPKAFAEMLMVGRATRAEPAVGVAS
jgi:type VI secretion system protein ImpM